MKYKRTESTNGQVMFFIDGGRVKEEKIPTAILNQLDGNQEITIDAPSEEVQEAEPEIPRDQRTCFIDGEFAPYKRFLQLKTVYLCDEHQHNLTSGEVVYEMRKAGILED